MKLRWYGLLFAILVVAAGVVFWRVRAGGNDGPAFRTGEVRRGDLQVQVSATGTLNPVITVQVGSQVSGTIAHLYADFNDKVHEGQVLAQLDPTFLRAQVAQSQADLERARVQVRQAWRDSARVFPLGAEGLTSKAEVDAAQTALDAARASEWAARAALERARTNLEYATILSPIDGIVVSRDVDVGQTVAASLSAPTLFTIAQDLRQMQLEAAVDEADIGQVRRGQVATFTVDAFPDDRFEGRVHQIRLAPENIQNVVTYTVVIRVDNLDERLLPGMTANVSIVVDEAKDVLQVPAMALRFRPAGAAGSRPSGAAPSVRAAGQAGEGSAGRPGGGRGTAEAGAPAAPPAAASVPGVARPGGGHPPDARSLSRRGTVHILAAHGQPRAVEVRTGPSDGTWTAIVSDSLREGDQVIVAANQSGRGQASQEQNVVNPFAPRMPGGRGQRR